MPTFDGKSEKFELLEGLFQISLNIQNQVTEVDRIEYFQSVKKGYALETFENICSPIRETLGETLAFFPRKNVKPQSIATAKHKLQKIAFSPPDHELVDFLEELHRLAKNAFGIAAHDINEQFIYANTQPHLNKLINQAHLENPTFVEILTLLERVIELYPLESPDEAQVKTVNQFATKNSAKPESTYHLCILPGHYKTKHPELKKQKNRLRTQKTVLETTTVRT